MEKLINRNEDIKVYRVFSESVGIDRDGGILMEDNRIDFIDFFICYLDRKIELSKDNELLPRIKLYLRYHKGDCLDYLYKSNKYKDSTIIVTNILRNIFSDLGNEITNILVKEE